MTNVNVIQLVTHCLVNQLCAQENKYLKREKDNVLFVVIRMLIYTIYHAKKIIRMVYAENVSNQYEQILI